MIIVRNFYRTAMMLSIYLIFIAVVNEKNYIYHIHYGKCILLILIIAWHLFAKIRKLSRLPNIVHGKSAVKNSSYNK